MQKDRPYTNFTDDLHINICHFDLMTVATDCCNREGSPLPLHTHLIDNVVVCLIGTTNMDDRRQYVSCGRCMLVCSRARWEGDKHGKKQNNSSGWVNMSEDNKVPCTCSVGVEL